MQSPLIQDGGDVKGGVTRIMTIDIRSGDAVGCIRNFVEYGTRIRQRLLAH